MSSPPWLTALLDSLSPQRERDRSLVLSPGDRVAVQTLLKRRPELAHRRRRRDLAFSVVALLAQDRASREKLVPRVEALAKVSLRARERGNGQGSDTLRLAGLLVIAAGLANLVFVLEQKPAPSKAGKTEELLVETSTSHLVDSWVEVVTSSATETISVEVAPPPAMPLADTFLLWGSGLCLLYAVHLWGRSRAPPPPEVVEARREAKKVLDEGRLAFVDDDERNTPYRVASQTSRHPPEPYALQRSLDALLGSEEVPTTRLDGERTVARVVAAGGLWVPVYARHPAVRTLTVLIDIEQSGTSAWLPRFRRWVAEWAAGGVDLAVYTFNEHPQRLQSLDPVTERTGGLTTLAALARKHPGPLILFSRLLRGIRRDRDAEWVEALAPFGPSAWVHPIPGASRGGRTEALFRRRGLRRFDGTDEGLAQVSAYLAQRSRIDPLPARIPDADRPEVQAALRRWAQLAALVPDPDWDLLEDLRRQPGVESVLDRPEHVSLLLEHLKIFGEGGNGEGPRLSLGRDNYRERVCAFTKEDPEAMLAARRLLLDALRREKAATELARVRNELRRWRHLAVLEPSEESLSRLRAMLDDPAIREEARLELDDVLAYLKVDPRSSANTLATVPEPRPLLEREAPNRVPWRWLVPGWGFVLGALLGTATAGLGQVERFRGAWLGQRRTEKVRAVPEIAVVRTATVPHLPVTKYRPALIAIPRGLFAMGSPKDEEGRYSDEPLPHLVRVERPYWMGRTEVTTAQWQAVMGGLPGGLSASAKPVAEVTWFSALEYLNRLSEAEDGSLTLCFALSGCSGSAPEGTYRCSEVEVEPTTGCTGYRLPTEEEWERAVRAGEDGPLYWPKAKLGDLAWFYANSARRSHAVAGKRPNRYGLHDMLGNVWEWTQTPWASIEPGAGVRVPEAYRIDATPNRVVNRGCGWVSDAGSCRAALRYADSPGSRFASLGFRLARSVPRPSIPRSLDGE